jgi:hypothetical protein
MNRVALCVGLLVLGACCGSRRECGGCARAAAEPLEVFHTERANVTIVEIQDFVEIP